MLFYIKREFISKEFLFFAMMATQMIPDLLDQFNPAVDSDFFIDFIDMIFDRSLGNRKFLCD